MFATIHDRVIIDFYRLREIFPGVHTTGHRKVSEATTVYLGRAGSRAWNFEKFREGAPTSGALETRFRTPTDSSQVVNRRTVKTRKTPAPWPVNQLTKPLFQYLKVHFAATRNTRCNGVDSLRAKISAPPFFPAFQRDTCERSASKKLSLMAEIMLQRVEFFKHSKHRNKLFEL